MKKLALIAALILAPTSQASTHSNPDPMDQGPTLTRFTTHMIELCRAEKLLDIHYTEVNPAYLEQRNIALSTDTLKHVPLDSKYNLITEIFVAYNASKTKPCEPVHVAQKILNSFVLTAGAQPEVLQSMMKLFLKTVMPKTMNLSAGTWATYAVEQSRNTALSIALRKKFAKLYPLIYPKQEAFMYKLLSEIAASK